jgi:hypothetical protein
LDPTTNIRRSSEIIERGEGRPENRNENCVFINSTPTSTQEELPGTLLTTTPCIIQILKRTLCIATAP